MAPHQNRMRSHHIVGVMRLTTQLTAADADKIRLRICPAVVIDFSPGAIDHNAVVLAQTFKGRVLATIRWEHSHFHARAHVGDWQRRGWPPW